MDGDTTRLNVVVTNAQRGRLLALAGGERKLGGYLGQLIDQVYEEEMSDPGGRVDVRALAATVADQAEIIADQADRLQRLEEWAARVRASAGA